jgi:DNA-binding Lrp family transcriptional regulator
MFINKDISKKDKIILNKLGKDADTPVHDLMRCAHYKRKSSVYNRIRHLREENYLYGPYFNINYNAIGENKLYAIFAIAYYHTQYRNVVLKAMREINCWTMLYPVRTTEAYLGVYRCNNWNYIASLFKMMNCWGWLKDYAVYKSEHRWVMQNPNFFGEFIPPSDFEIPSGRVPQCWYQEETPDIEFTKTDLVVLKHLSRKTCHLTEIRDLEYHYYGLKLNYHDLKRSYKRLKENNILIKKNYLIFPLPVDMCSFFFLFTQGTDLEFHLQVISHFGKDFRLTKKFILVGNRVVSYFMTHPLLEGKILGIIEKKLDYSRIYGIKTYPSDEMATQSFNDDYFNLDCQKWVFPYSEFRKKIKEIKEKGEGT